VAVKAGDNRAGAGKMSLLGATGVGVAAIVGGGILALAGTAFAVTGPSAVVAFALNGIIAVITALSFAELSSAFPQSGGTYTFAKKVLSVQSAFAVGWIVWFASVVAAVLYALGFGVFALELADTMIGSWPEGRAGWRGGMIRPATIGGIATGFYMIALMRKSSGGGHWVNIGKLVAFAVLIGGGLWAMGNHTTRELGERLTPFFAMGGTGLLEAMGFTFVAWQGFDLVATVAGEVRDPKRNVPRAMLLSLGIALAVYVPFLLVVAALGTSSGSITAAASAAPDTIVAIAARNYLGEPGYWLVLTAALMAMLSALRANLFAASRVALAMARDRTLPEVFAVVDEERGTPISAVAITSLLVVVILHVVPNVSAAGATASLIFLTTFATAQAINVLARRRRGAPSEGFSMPGYPWTPGLGIAACLALAVFQGVMVPAAGFVAVVWLIAGAALYLPVLRRRALVVDAAALALDPDLVRLRGRNPLVLLPVANPEHTHAMVAVADALTPPGVGRVLVLNVVVAPNSDERPATPPSLGAVQAVLDAAIASSTEAAQYPETLITVAEDPWPEIYRVALSRRCQSLLLGFSSLDDESARMAVERLMTTVDCDVVVLRSAPGWQLGRVEHVLVAVGGRGGHDVLRARLLGSLHRTGARTVTFLRIMPVSTPERTRRRAQRELEQFARDEAQGQCRVEVVQSDAVLETITERAEAADLLILGLRHETGGRNTFGQLTVHIARETTCSIIMISRLR